MSPVLDLRILEEHLDRAHRRAPDERPVGVTRGFGLARRSWSRVPDRAIGIHLPVICGAGLPDGLRRSVPSGRLLHPAHGAARASRAVRDERGRQGQAFFDLDHGAMVSICSALGAGFVAATLSDVFDGNRSTSPIVLSAWSTASSMSEGILAGRALRGWLGHDHRVGRPPARRVILVSLIRTHQPGLGDGRRPVGLFAMAWWRRPRDTRRRQHPPRSSSRLRGGGAPLIALAGAPLAVLAFGGDSGLLSVLFFTFALSGSDDASSRSGPPASLSGWPLRRQEHQPRADRASRRYRRSVPRCRSPGRMADRPRWWRSPTGRHMSPRTVAMLVAAGVVAATMRGCVTGVGRRGRTMRLGQSWGAGSSGRWWPSGRGASDLAVARRFRLW